MTGKIHTIGTRAQVWHGTAKKTSGGLTKSDLIMNKAGRLVSKSKHNSAKKEMRLLKFGYGTQKGKFGFVKIGSKSRRSSKSKSRKMRGGMMPLAPLNLNSGDGIDGQGITPGGPQTLAGMAGGKRRSRRMRGGSGMSPLGNFANVSLSGNGIDGQGITPGGPQTLAGMAGGKSRSRGMRGGSGMSPLGDFGSANWAGDGIDGQGITSGDAGSANIQLLAGMAGGRRRARGKSMRGGLSKNIPYGNNNPQTLALSAGF
jgi:hypothetical protein